jgi:uncharacterized membrane protein YheB (UPF0754 family)
MEVIELIKLFSIPCIAAFVGWTTNWVAVKLTFYPYKFIGIPPFLGWQGVIPSKARKMAEICVDSVLGRIGTLEEIVAELEPKKICTHIVADLQPRSDELVDEIMRKRHKLLWQNLPANAKNIVYARIQAQLPHTVESLVDEIEPKIGSLLDLKRMIVARLEYDKSLLNKIFLECGAKEFKFIVKSGLGFGFIFGLIQLLVWLVFPNPWVMPVAGFIVGWLTNWLALNVIFRPVREVKVLGWPIQGLFLKRQDEVAEVFCHIVTHEIITVEHIAEAMLTNPQGERTRAIIQSHFEGLVDEVAGLARPLAQAAVGFEEFANLKQDVGEKAINLSKSVLANPVFNEERSKVVCDLMTTRMQALPPEQFQDLLRPCFQEDEYKLIMIGGVLGAAAGVLQLAFVFSVALF